MGIKNAVRQQGRIGLLLIALMTVGIGCQAQEPEFLKHATRVAGIGSPGRPSIPPKYWWLNPTQLLVTQRLEHFDADGTLFRYDIPTHRSTRLDALMQRLDVPPQSETLRLLCLGALMPRPFIPRSDAYTSSRYETMRVSPDGEWALAMDFNPATVYATRVDGSAVFHSVPSSNQPKIYWTNDSRHWVALAYAWNSSLIAMVYDVASAGKPVTFPTSSSLGQGNAFSNMGIDSTQSLVVNDRILTCNAQGLHANGTCIEIVETGINLPAQSLQTRYIWLPPDCVLQEMQVAPSGDQIAWICTQKPWPAVTWLPNRASLNRGYIQQGMNTMSVWVSNIDGSQMHRLASVTGNHWDDWALEDLAWVPGEQRVSFNCHGALWTLPVSIEDIATRPR